MKVIQGFLSEDERWYLANLAETIPFEPGRQGTGYEKSPVLISRNEMGGFTRLLGSQYTHCEMILKRSLSVLAETCGQHELAHDCYLLRFGEGAHIPPHLDDAPLGTEHHRINALISDAFKGGELGVGSEQVILKPRDAYVFRPDTELHEVKLITRGTRLIWSVGVLQ